jgi:YbbR domain-containing protein
VSGLVDALNSIRIFFTSNLGLKASAIGLAMVMFSLVHGAEDMERSVYVGVVVQPPPDADDMILVTEIPDRVRVRIRGSRARLNAIRQENLPPVDVVLKTADEPRFYFEKEMFDLPTGVTVVEVVPPSLAFKWVPRATRDLPVEVPLGGNLPRGLEWASPPEVFPETVEVEGPRDIVNSMRTVRSMEIDVSELREGVVQRELPLVGTPVNTTFVTPTVVVTLRVQAKMGERVFPSLRVNPEGGMPRAIRPRVVALRVRGPEIVVDALDPASVQASVDVTRIPDHRGSISLPVQIRGLPDKVDVLDVDPPMVNVLPALDPMPAQ